MTILLIDVFVDGFLFRSGLYAQDKLYTNEFTASDVILPDGSLLIARDLILGSFGIQCWPLIAIISAVSQVEIKPKKKIKR